MKKITLLVLFFITLTFNAQTIAWESDSEDTTDWGINDLDGDGNNWGTYSGGGESFGFSSGAIFFSKSWESEPAPNGTVLTPDNLLLTPTFNIPTDALTISFKMKVAATDPNDFAEKFAVLVFDSNDNVTAPLSIHEEILTAGGDASAKDITATIPATFSGKTLGLIIRHFDCTDQNQLLIDDFEVSYTTSLSTEDKLLKITSVYPNPTTDIITIKTNETIDYILITNQLGQQVLELKKDAIFKNSVDISNLSKGVYFLSIKAKEKIAIRKIIKA